jgi:hypothetical protein
VEADTDQIVSLLKLSLGNEGPIPRDRDYWSWKHMNSPFGRSPMLVADVGGSLVGLRAFMHWRWRSGSRKIRAVRAVDTVTHPDWRGQRIFYRLTLSLIEQMKADEVSFIFNTPNNLSRPGYLKMGWSSLGPLSVWIRPCRPLKFIQKMIWRERGQEVPITSEHEEESIQEFLNHSKANDFLKGLRAEDSRLVTPITPEYLRWRYDDIPGFDYHISCRWRGNSGAAIVSRIRARGTVRELRLCEILVNSNDESIKLATQLIQELMRNSRTEYVAALAGPRTPERRVLLNSGFLLAPRVGPVLTVLPLSLSAKESDPLRRRTWRLSIGDLELF